jgi:hypothetical protein
MYKARPLELRPVAFGMKGVQPERRETVASGHAPSQPQFAAALPRLARPRREWLYSS